MGNEKIGEAEGFFEVDQDVKHLRLHRNVERRGRFIQDQKLGRRHKGTGDGNALALSAGKFMGILFECASAKANAIHQLFRSLFHLLFGCTAQNAGRLQEDILNRHAGRKGRIRILKNDLHFASDLTDGLFFRVSDVLPAEEDLP